MKTVQWDKKILIKIERPNEKYIVVNFASK